MKVLIYSLLNMYKKDSILVLIVVSIILFIDLHPNHPNIAYISICSVSNPL